MKKNLYDQLFSLRGWAYTVSKHSPVPCLRTLFGYFLVILKKKLVIKFLWLDILFEMYQDNMSVCFIPPYTPLLYSKTGVYRGIHFFLFLLQNIDCGYSLEQRVPSINVLSKNKKNIKKFHLKIIIFTAFKN